MSDTISLHGTSIMHMTADCISHRILFVEFLQCRTAKKSIKEPPFDAIRLLRNAEILYRQHMCDCKNRQTAAILQ